MYVLYDAMCSISLNDLVIIENNLLKKKEILREGRKKGGTIVQRTIPIGRQDSDRGKETSSLASTIAKDRVSSPSRQIADAHERVS